MGPECCHKWPKDLTVENLIVVSTTSGNGEWIFGWFVRFDCKPQHLFRVPTHYVRLLARRFNRLTANPTEVRVMNEFRDAILLRPDLDFVAVADVRFQRRGLALTREVRTSKKRKKAFVPQPYVDEHEGESGPGSPPSSPEREDIESCPICMEEGQVLLGFYCCKAGMACESCLSDAVCAPFATAICCTPTTGVRTVPTRSSCASMVFHAPTGKNALRDVLLLVERVPGLRSFGLASSSKKNAYAVAYLKAYPRGHSDRSKWHARVARTGVQRRSRVWKPRCRCTTQWSGAGCRDHGATRRGAPWPRNFVPSCGEREGPRQVRAPRE